MKWWILLLTHLEIHQLLMNLCLSFPSNCCVCVFFWWCSVVLCRCFVGDAQFSEALGYPMVQQWRVRSNLYKVKLSSITLSTGQCLRSSHHKDLSSILSPLTFAFTKFCIFSLPLIDLFDFFTRIFSTHQHVNLYSSFLSFCYSPISSLGFSKVLKTLSAASTRDELLSFLQQYGSHYVSEALYGSELSCSIYFPSKKAQQQLWLQYQKGECADRQDGGQKS